MIEIKNISSGYGKKEIIHNITISFEKGKTVGIVGPNGCGKSTLLKTILGIHPKKSGDVFIDGKNTSAMKKTETAKYMSYLAQGMNVPDMTVEQLVLHGRFPYLTYPKRYTKKDYDVAYRSMKKMGIKNYSHMYISELSGGMRQNAYIAMALTQDTDYIFLDEPTTYLDISHQIALMKTLNTLTADGKGVITVLHDLPMAFNYSDEIIVMHKGQVVMQGTPDKIAESGIIEKLFHISLQKKDIYYYSY